MKSYLTAPAVAAVLLLAGCSSASSGTQSAPTTAVQAMGGSAQPAAAPTTTAVAPAPTCTLPDDHDVIVRMVTPGSPASAQVLGEADLANCTTTLAMIAQTSPTGVGFCTQVAYVSDNPGYNADADVAAPLKHVLESIGDSC